MSKFIDKLTRSYKNLSPAIGFRSAAQDADDRPMLLIADLAGATDSTLKTMAGSGIDAAVIDGDKVDGDGLKPLIDSIGDIPLGLLSEKPDAKKVDEFINLGGDFLIFGPLTPVDVVNKEGIGKILTVTPKMEPGIVRAIAALDLPVDSVLVQGDELVVTVERLLVCQLIAGLVSKPLLTAISTALTPGELSSLYKSGVNGLLLPKGFKAKAVSGLKEKINDLPKVTKRKSSGSALIPRIGGLKQVDAEEEEEDEEEDI